MADSWIDPYTVANPGVGDTTDADWGDAVNASINFLANAPTIKVRKTGTQSVATATADALDNSEFDLVSWDAVTAPGWHSTDYGSFWSSGSYLTIPTASAGTNAGRYLITCVILWDPPAGATTDQVAIRLCAGLAAHSSLADGYVIASMNVPAAYAYPQQTLCAEADLNEGDTVAVWVNHNVGASKDLAAGCTLSASWVGLLE
jgi:hypothetical protein